MSIKKYETFVKVIEMGSLTKAAEALGYTQSAVSHIISGLEDEFGFTMFLRSRAGVRLTTNGKRILPAIRGILNYNEQLNQIVASINGLNSGMVRVGTFTSVAVHWLPGMIKEFQNDYPRIEFKLMSGDYHDIEQWMTEGAIDLGFVTLPTTLDCECVPLREDRLLAILPAGHRLAKRSSIQLAEIENEQFISLLETSDHDARRALEAAGVKPNIRYTTKDDYAIIAMVENGLGISIMPELLLQGRTDNIKALDLEPKAKRTIGLAIPAASTASPATRRFAEHICKWVEKNYSNSPVNTGSYN